MYGMLTYHQAMPTMADYSSLAQQYHSQQQHRHAMVHHGHHPHQQGGAVPMPQAFTHSWYVRTYWHVCDFALLRESRTQVIGSMQPCTARSLARL